MGSEFKTGNNSFTNEEVAAQEERWKFILGFTPTALVKCAIELGIPDILENHESPMTLADLTLELKCSQSTLYRIMRFLKHYKVFQEKPISETSVRYTRTPISRLLTRNGKHSMADLLLLESTPVMLAPWHKLSAWVLGNEVLPFEAAHGNDLWGFGAENPGHSKLFNDGMACDARAGVAAVIGGCPEVFEGVRTLVDVGGGDGTAIRLIVEACPWIKGINFDLPHVVSEAPESEGVEHVGGSMFDHVPKADVVYLMKVLHDWADDDCIAILKKC
ncbi:acetylserotonin O-methyltransferase-like [Bidens hawaiensis]|uniref:acetylserotonin O-methyltransferase-like n=1 Tax=Bidens hawaiensis TaxID=980011 RepID=UPI00404B35F4